MTWYLVFYGVVSWLGPMTQQECLAARDEIFKSAACMEARVMTTCIVPGHPQYGRACPDFYMGPLTSDFK